jgi:protein-arginine kinase activator protein McsA
VRKMDDIKRFDLDKKPVRERFFLTPIAWLLSFPDMWKRKLQVTKVNMTGLKPPYILLATHHSFQDFKVTTAAIFPRRANYIVAIDGFIGREWLLRNAGGICKRKFTNDLKLFKQIKYSLETLKNIVAIYPEARYSLCGTTAILPDSLSKMIKVLKHPVVMLNMHGNYLTQPVWNLSMRKLSIAADLTQIITKEEIETISVEEINTRVHQAFQYDEYKWQKDNNVRIDFKDRAKGLHHVLYQCPSCLTEHEMDSDLNMLWCNHCKKTYEMDVYGALHATAGVTEFSHIPDWYEFEREQVKKQISDGTYQFEDEVNIESLPNAKGYIPLGKGKLIHGRNGFILTGDEKGKPLQVIKEPLAMYSLHIEYDYMKKGDCIDLSTLNDTYYIYPLTKMNCVTKLHFATEELYKLDKAKIGLSKQSETSETPENT